TYGGVTQVEGMDDVLAVVLTGDNVGPPSEAAVAATYDALRRDYPDARVIGSSLDAYAVALDAARDHLSVVTAEIGDTWIQGVGTDPTKVRHYRELSRLRRAWLERDLSTADRARVDAMSRHLVMIPEHTWGMDEKTHLADYERYDAAGLADLRQSDAGRRCEASWAEQSSYVAAALGELDGSPLADEAKTRLAAIEPRMIDLSGCEPTDDYRLRNERFDVNFDAATGAIISLFDRRDA